MFRSSLKLPARTLVPALLTVFALLIVAFNHTLQVREYRHLVEDEQTMMLVERLGGEQRRFDEMIADGNVAGMRRAVAELALRPHITHAYLTVPGGRIVGSLSRSDFGQTLTDALEKDARGGRSLLDVQKSPGQSVAIDIEPGGGALIALLLLDSGHQLMVRSDLGLPLAQRLQLSRVELWRDALMILCGSLILSVLLHLLWFRRAARLTSAARALGEGRFDTRVNPGGGDELAEIGAAFNDMAARLQAQHAALQDSERQFRAMFEQVAAGVARIDTRLGRFVAVNRKYCEIIGYGESEILELDFMRITHADDLAADLQQMAALRSGAIREFSMDKRLLHKDGRTLWVTLSVSPLWEPGDEPDFHLAVIQDITARREAELALKLERNRLEAAERIACLGSWEFYPALGRGWWSRQMFDLLGIDPANGTPDTDTFLLSVHPDDRPQMHGLMSRMHKAVLDDLPTFRTDPACGTLRHVKPSMRQVLGDDGQLLKYAGTLIDVTDAVEAECALRGSEERLRASLEYAPNVAVQWFDRDGRVLYWNHASTRLYGWSPDEAMGRTVSQLMLMPEEARDFTVLLADIAATGKAVGPSEYPIRDRGGKVKYVEATTFSIPGLAGEPIFVCMDVDVTARREAEQSVEQKRTHLQTLIDTLPDMVWLKSPEGVYLSCNRMFERLCGLPEAELIGKTDYQLFARDQADHFRAHDERAVSAGKNCVNEESVILPETGQRALLQTIKTPMRSADGELVGVLGIARDITELRETQDSLRELNHELEQRVVDRTQALSEAMKVFELFSYAVSHDLKAPLRGVDGYSKILLDDYGDRLDGQAQRFLRNIRSGVAQMNALIEDLMSYSRIERRSLEPSRVDLGEVM
jgi:PAS domain S-box-containing protein